MIKRLFERLFGKKSKTENDLKQQYDLIQMKEFIYYESAFQHQQIKFRRATESNRLRLGEILTYLFGDEGIDEASVLSMAVTHRVANNPGVKTENIFDTPSSVWNFDVFDCVLKGKADDGHYKLVLFDENTLIVRTKIKTCVLVLTPIMSGVDTVDYMRVSVLSLDNADTDDGSTMKSPNRPMICSFILSYSETDNDPLFRQYADLEKNVQYKQAKNLPRNEVEVEYVAGQLEFKFNHLDYGKWLFDQERYFDAYSILEREYNYLKSSIFEGSDNLLPNYRNVCGIIGTCLDKIDRREEAAYYLKQAGQDYRLAIPSHIDSYNTEITIGYVLRTYWGLNEKNIAPCMFVYEIGSDKFLERIEDAGQIINYILSPKTATDKVFVLSCTHANNPNTDFRDKSILCINAPIIIVSHKVNCTYGSPRIRVDMLHQNFATNDEKKHLVAMNIPLNATFSIGQPNEAAFNDDIESLKVGIAKSIELINQKRFIEALKLSKWVFDCSVYISENADDVTKEAAKDMFYDSSFYTGYCLMELEKTTMAAYYLEISSCTYIANHLREYINCMIALKDPRALEVVESVLEQSAKPQSDAFADAWEEHIAFLKRRKAYILIEKKRYAEARRMLEGMLDDPMSQGFAMRELSYLNQIAN